MNTLLTEKEGPDRSQETRASGASPRFGQPDVGRLRHPLSDPPATPSPEHPAAPPTPATSPEGGADGTEAPTPAQTHVCAHCGTPLREGQQWCLHCGACEPGSLGERPNLRPLTVLALTAAILALGAAVAVAAAIDEHGSTPRSATVALVPATTPTTAVPTTPAPSATTPGTGGTTTPHSSPKSSSGSNLLFPPSPTTKPPKVTSPTPTPEASGGSNSAGESSGSGAGSTTSGSTTTPSKATTTETGTSTTESKSKAGAGTSEQPTPILLDTNAATTYNPYNYPESGFGDPALAIDSEPSTAWTAQVQAHSFPGMAEGLLIALREPAKLGRIELRTPTRGMAVQVYGAGGAKAPTTITEPGWVLLSGSHTLKKTVTHLRLHTEGHTFRWLVVWLVKAPASAQGTPAAPGHVALSEVALYPPAP